MGKIQGGELTLIFEAGCVIPAANGRSFEAVLPSDYEGGHYGTVEDQSQNSDSLRSDDEDLVVSAVEVATLPEMDACTGHQGVLYSVKVKVAGFNSASWDDENKILTVWIEAATVEHRVVDRGDTELTFGVTWSESDYPPPHLLQV